MTFPSLDIPEHIYFVTASVIGWKRLFSRPEYSRLLLDSLAWLQSQRRLLLFAYVIMPSHLHIIAKPEGRSIGELLQQLGSFTAHRLLKEIESQGEAALLQYFEQNRRDARHRHSLWQDIQAKNVYSLDFLWQKIQYIHQNPIAGEHPLVADRAEYPYSSAGYYDCGRPGLIEITDINAWLSGTPAPGTAQGA